jgi:pimeloyl-ACP methyl ester carboxylesterase
LLPEIILIHGAGGGSWQWRFWREVLEAENLTHQAVDLVAKEENLATTHFRDYVSQVVAVAQKSPRPPILIGVSMGGMLALKSAELLKTSALVLLNSLPPAAIDSWHQKRIRFPDIIPWGSRVTLDDTRRAMPEASDEIIRWAHSQWRDESGLVMRTLYHGIPTTSPKVPTLILNGAADRTVKPVIGEEMARRFGSDYICFTKVSHVGILLGRRAPFIARLTVEWLSHALL